jgi:hypothetical protein
VLSARYELILSTLWAQELQCGPVEPDVSFEELGGDLEAAEAIVLDVLKVFRTRIPAQSLFGDTQTVRDMALRLESLRRSDLQDSGHDVNGTFAAPVSFGQQRFWVLHELMPNNPFYNVPYAFWLHGALDVTFLARALDGLISRHEMLRTTFPEINGMPCQAVSDSSSLQLEVINFDEDVESGNEDTVLELARTEARRPFDLARGPIVRALLLPTTHGRSLFVLLLHHIAVDGWSLNVMARDLSEIYMAYKEKRSPQLPVLTSTYRKFAVWERDWMRGPVLARELNWWRARLQGAPRALPLPVKGRRRPAVASFAGSAIYFQVPEETVERLRGIARVSDSTLFMALLAACHSFLALISDTTDIIVGTPVARRTRPGFSDAVGYFANTIVMRGDCSGDPSFEDLVRRVRAWAVDAYAHQDLPFDVLVRDLIGDRDLSRSPLAQVLIQLEPADAILTLPDVTSERIDNLEGGARSDLEFHFHEGSALNCQLVYAIDLFDDGVAHRLLSAFLMLLDHFSRSPNEKVWRYRRFEEKLEGLGRQG